MKKFVTLAICILMLFLWAAGCATTNEKPSDEDSSTSDSADVGDAADSEESETTIEVVAQPEGYPSETVELILSVNAGVSLDL